MSFTKPARTTFGKRLRECRQRAGIPQERLGVLIGIDESSSGVRISRYETGIHEPSIRLAERMAEALNVPVAYFYCPDDELASVISGFGSLDAEKRKELREFLDGLLAAR
jgi:transcriptional regulator with XRE-family HTH domain